MLDSSQRLLHVWTCQSPHSEHALARPADAGWAALKGARWAWPYAVSTACPPAMSCSTPMRVASQCCTESTCWTCVWSRHMLLVDSPGVVFAPQQSGSAAEEALRSHTKARSQGTFTRGRAACSVLWWHLCGPPPRAAAAAAAQVQCWLPAQAGRTQQQLGGASRPCQLWTAAGEGTCSARPRPTAGKEQLCAGRQRGRPHRSRGPGRAALPRPCADDALQGPQLRGRGGPAAAPGRQQGEAAARRRA